MIPNDHKPEQIFSNAETGSEFAIHQNAAMFTMLSDGLYSDKVGAIVRELACNAYDSHIEAGCEERPIEITVPTTMTHEFAVEDFGIGMDEETVRTVFAGYFNSSKRNNNDVTGAFGLGSKTPFIFNDTFTVRARKDGVERVFTAYMKDGVPHLAKTSENAARGVSDGVKVTVPVSPDYADRFTKSVKEKLCWFKVPPKIINRNDIEIIPNEAVDLEVGGIMRVEGDYRPRIRVLMGNVVYNVEFDSIGLSDNMPNYMNKCWVMRVPMGSVSITPSRESLSLDDETIETVKALFTRAYHEYVNSKWSEVVSSSFNKITRRIDIVDFCATASIIFNTWDYPKSKYGYHKFTRSVSFVRETYKKNSTGVDKRTGKVWVDVIKHLFQENIDMNNTKANIKCIRLTTHGIDVTSTYGNPVQQCNPRVPKHAQTLSHDGGVIEFFETLAVVGRAKFVRKLHIVSHETMKTKPTTHMKVINAFINSNDITLDVMARDFILYIPTVINDAVKLKLQILLSRIGFSDDHVVYHGFDELRNRMHPELRAQREKASRKLTDAEREERKEKLIITCHSPEVIARQGHALMCTHDLENDAVMYLTITKSYAEDMRKYDSSKEEFLTLQTLAEIMAKINGDKRVCTIIKHGNNSAKIEKAGIESLTDYLVRVITKQLNSKVGRKRMDEVVSMFTATLVINHSRVKKDRMLYANAISEVYPKGAISGLVKRVNDIKDMFENKCDEYDVSFEGIIDADSLKRFIDKSFSEDNSKLIGVADAIKKTRDAIDNIIIVLNFFDDDLCLPTPCDNSWQASKRPERLVLLVEVVKNSAEFIDGIFIEKRTY